MLRKISAGLVCSALISTSVFAAVPIDAKLFPCANSRIYVAQSLLHDDESWDVAYEMLRDIIKNDDTINSVSKKKIKKAASLIRNYNLSKPLYSMTGYGQYKTRPYIEAQMYLAEALMDSRIFLNQSFDSEVAYVDELLKNYFFPLQGDNVKIIYPNASSYAFNRWAFSKEGIEAAQTGKAVEEDGFFDFLGSASSSSSSSSTSNSTSSNSNNGPKGIPTPPNFQKPTAPVTPTNPSVTVPVQNLQAGTSEINPKGFVDQEKGIIEDATEVVDVVVEVADKAKDLIKAYEQNEEKNSRINNRYIGQSMLVQALAEPGSVLVDPQLQEFLKGIRIEYSLGEVDMPKRFELEDINENLGETIIQGSDSNVQIDLSKLFQVEREGTYSALKLEYRSVPGKAGRATLFVVSSVSGEDLMFNRVLQHAASLAQNADLIANSKAAEVGTKAVDTIPKFLVHLGEAVKNTVKYGKEAENLGAYSSVWNSAKKTLVWGLAKAEAPKVAITKIVQSPVMQKVLDNTVRTNFVQSGHLFNSLIALGVIIEVTTGIIEMNKAETQDEKRVAREEMLARTGGQLLYLLPYVGVAAMSVDFLHYTMGLPVESADLFRGAGYLGESIGLWMAGYNHTTFRLTELELKYEVPRHEVHLWKHAYNLESMNDAVNGKQMIYNEIQDIALKNISVLYLAHRSTKDKSNYDFGKRLAEYKSHFELQNLLVAKQALNKIDKQVEGLRLKEKVNQDLAGTVDQVL